MNNAKTIKVVPYNPEWPNMFETEAGTIKAALGDNCMTVYHIGSTSVPSLSAKPIIDIIAAIKDPIQAIKSLEALGFIYKGEYNISFRFYFTKRESVNVNLHMYEEGHPEIELNLQFKNYLIKHSEVRQEYAALKENLLLQETSFEKCEVF